MVLFGFSCSDHSLSWREIRIETQGNKLEARTEKRDHGGILIIGLVPTACSVG